MVTIIKELRALRHNGARQSVRRGGVPYVQLTNEKEIWLGWWIFLITAIVVSIAYTLAVLWLTHRSTSQAVGDGLNNGIMVGMFVAILYYLLPILRVISFTVLHRQRPSRQILNDFSAGQKFVCLALMAFGLVYSFNHGYPVLMYALHTHHWPHHWLIVKPFVKIWWHLVIIVLGMTIVLEFLVPRLLPKEMKPRKTRFKNASNSESNSSCTTTPFTLWLGRSTGRLASLWHQTDPATIFRTHRKETEGIIFVTLRGG